MIAWIKLDSPLLGKCTESCSWLSFINLAFVFRSPTEVFSLEGHWTTDFKQNCSSGQEGRLDHMLKSRAVQAEACVNPYSIVSRMKFLLLHSLTFFFSHLAWLRAVQEEKMSFSLCYTATYILLTLWQLLLCVQTHSPV